MKKIILLFITFLSVVTAQYSCKYSIRQEQENTIQEMGTVFNNAPDSIQTSVYWYWISDNISKEGVIKDLEAMKNVGINRAFIGNIGLAQNEVPYGDIKLFSDEWWDILHTALKKATELNIEIGIFNSPGWSQSGGPWIKPDQSMRFLKTYEIDIDGPTVLDTIIGDQNGDYFEHNKTLAFPWSITHDARVLNHNAVIEITQGESVDALFDDDLDSEYCFSADTDPIINIKTNELLTLRTIRIHTSEKYSKAKAEIIFKKNGLAVKSKIIEIDRTNSWLIVGFEPFAPIVETLPEIETNEFEIRFTDVNSDFVLKEIELTEQAMIERYPEKSLAKMYQSPLPYWDTYLWPKEYGNSPENDIKKQQILDISDFVDQKGRLRWNVPPGKWKILHTGMASTGVVNDPASPEGTGLEVDKMSKSHIKHHFDSFIGEIIQRIPQEDRKTWKVVVADSYERGGQNWTDDFVDRFSNKYGYDPIPFIPVLDGYVIENRDVSNRFLWDVRRMVADDLAYEYLGHLREICHENDLTIWLENYGHWGFPGEFLQYGGQSDEVAGEFWSEGELGNIENRAASSCAHIYGKRKVSAESFTCAGNLFSRVPSMMKKRGDKFFTEGINNTLLHVYIHQPEDSIKPGINAWFGNEFNRHNTWFEYMDVFTEYLKRCNYLLQQGLYVADFAYFIGEDAPKMTGVCDPPLPTGYSYDFINAEVILERLSVKDGRFVLPDGMSYKVLVLPRLETMRPNLLEKIYQLVEQGGIVVGSKPIYSPSLQDYPEADQQVDRIASELWTKDNSTNKLIQSIGKGKIIDGYEMNEILSLLKIEKDFHTSDSDSILYIHKKQKDIDIYFLSNQSESKTCFNGVFRVGNKKPQFWDPVTGELRNLSVYSTNPDQTVVSLELDKHQSGFVVFHEKSPTGKWGGDSENFKKPVMLHELAGPWKVKFDDDMRGPTEWLTFSELSDWRNNDSDSVKFYSGSARYQIDCHITEEKNAKIFFLSIGELNGIARIYINGELVGGIWTSPWRINITDQLVMGKNDIEVEVVNTWVNRLIGDSRLKDNLRETWCSVNPYTPDDELHVSGLIGPVNIFYIDE